MCNGWSVILKNRLCSGKWTTQTISWMKITTQSSIIFTLFGKTNRCSLWYVHHPLMASSQLSFALKIHRKSMCLVTFYWCASHQSIQYTLLKEITRISMKEYKYVRLLVIGSNIDNATIRWTATAWCSDLMMWIKYHGSWEKKYERNPENYQSGIFHGQSKPLTPHKWKAFRQNLDQVNCDCCTLLCKNHCLIR